MKKCRRDRVSLCGFWKENIRGRFNLHELPAEAFKTLADEVTGHRKRQPDGKPPLTPVATILANHMSDITFINRRMTVHNRSEVAGRFITGKDSDLLRKSNLRIRDDR